MMKKQHKNARDYALTGIGAAAALTGTAFVLAEIPAVLMAGVGVLVAGKALKRLKERDELTDKIGWYQ